MIWRCLEEVGTEPLKDLDEWCPPSESTVGRRGLSWLNGGAFPAIRVRWPQITPGHLETGPDQVHL